MLNSSVLSLFFLLFLNQFLLGQGIIELENPSFEGTPGNSTLPEGWYNCGFVEESPPDLQPGSFGITQKAVDGNTYLGMVARDNRTWEAIGQRLKKPLKAGINYKFSIHLATHEAFSGLSRLTDKEVKYNTPLKIRVWAGNQFCEQRELLAESAPVSHSTWEKSEFEFKTRADHPFIMIEAAYDEQVGHPYNGNILIDKCSNLTPVN